MPGASNYAYLVPEQDPWGDRNPRTKEDAAFDQLDAQGVLHVVKRAMATEQEIAAAGQFHKDIDTFRVMYPSYLDNDHNAKLMKYHWENVLGTTLPQLEEIEESFFTLRNSGVLQLHQAAVKKENERGILSRAAELREKREAEAFNEADAYTLPFEELERRARRS
jgi:hypothetical protein